MSIEVLTNKELEQFGTMMIQQISEIIKGTTPKDYSNKEEALKLLRCSSRQLDELRNHRQVSFTRVGREYVYKTQSLIDLLNSRLVESVN